MMSKLFHNNHKNKMASHVSDEVCGMKSVRDNIKAFTNMYAGKYSSNGFEVARYTAISSINNLIKSYGVDKPGPCATRIRIEHDNDTLIPSAKIRIGDCEYIPNTTDDYVRGMIDALKLVHKEASGGSLKIGGNDD